jgi:hypothetical protein
MQDDQQNNRLVHIPPYNNYILQASGENFDVGWEKSGLRNWLYHFYGSNYIALQGRPE